LLISPSVAHEGNRKLIPAKLVEGLFAGWMRHYK